MKITIGVCVKNNERTIRGAVTSILKQSYGMEKMQLIIVDGCSTDKTLSIVESAISEIDMSVKILSDKGKGLGAARQMVVDNSKGDYLVFVDGDVELQKDFVQKQVDLMEENPKVALAVGKYMLKEGNLLSTVWNLSCHVAPQLGTDGTIFRLKALRQVGGFDENIRGASEDTDVIFRICQNDWSFSENEKAGFYHNSRQSFKELWKEQAWIGFGSHYLNQKHGCLNPLWRRLPPGSLIYGLKLALKSYRLTSRKISFLIPSLMVFGKTAWWFGFIQAQFNEYGHHAHENH
jgi:glycosyltransferase involved in cell wall biosynthesis